MLDNQVLEEVDKFKFLRSHETSSGNCSKYIKIQISMAKQKAVKLDNISGNDTCSAQVI